MLFDWSAESALYIDESLNLIRAITETVINAIIEFALFL
jgi:hypothetical protein